MKFPVQLHTRKGDVITLNDEREHTLHMLHCQHDYGWPPGVCAWCLSYAVWERRYTRER